MAAGLEGKSIVIDPEIEVQIPAFGDIDGDSDPFIATRRKQCHCEPAFSRLSNLLTS